MSDRLIMLDVPGVLFSERSAARLGGIPEPGMPGALRRFDAVAVGFVRRLFGVTGARVVLPHEWGHGAAQALIQQLDLQVQAFAPDAPGGFAGQIDAWLARQPAAPRMAVLSADPAMAMSLFGAAAIVVDPEVGLTVDDYRLALDKLGVADPAATCPSAAPDAALRERLRRLGRSLPHAAGTGAAVPASGRGAPVSTVAETAPA
ncbi:HAD domain-containing protein [Cupriavidus sp. AU9028]|uniref:HAD domain-containing protein n=1 Tax=Cupriavidus sp. AU9028 TaxID=2871157 RepID=UPI001C954F9E|nr:HAD domain-containing protein [Cupriavidus sp. AU9028]MBY4896971.1 hypothetical protein [Cupriavidus sp. AU9028]